MENPFETLQKEIQNLAADVNAIRKMISGQKPPSKRKDLLDMNGLIDYIAERTGKVYSKDTIYAYTSKGLLEFIKPGKELFFEPDYIDRWLMEDRHDKTASLKRKADHMMIRANKKRLKRK